MSSRDVREHLTKQLVGKNAALQAAELWMERANEAVLLCADGRIDGPGLAGMVNAYAHATQAAIRLAEFYRGEQDRIEAQMAESKTWEMRGTLL